MFGRPAILFRHLSMIMVESDVANLKSGRNPNPKRNISVKGTRCSEIRLVNGVCEGWSALDFQ